MSCLTWPSNGCFFSNMTVLLAPFFTMVTVADVIFLCIEKATLKGGKISFIVKISRKHWVIEN